MMLKDRKQTRITEASVDAYWADRDVNHSRKEAIEAIQIVISGVAITLLYDNPTVRDEDMNFLDRHVLGVT